MTTEKIFIGIDDERIELTGEAKAAFLADRQAEADALAQQEANKSTKLAARAAVLAKLGLTDEEASALLA